MEMKIKVQNQKITERREENIEYRDFKLEDSETRLKPSTLDQTTKTQGTIEKI